MKQVFEQYASSVIAVFVSLTVLYSIGYGNFFDGQGINQVLGQVLNYSVGNAPIVENEAFEDYMRGEAPSIQTKNTYLVKNQRTALSECFEAKSKTGTTLPVYLDKVWSENGEAVSLELCSDKTNICLSEIGTYWIQIYTVDENKKSCSVVSKLLVNER